MKKFTFRSLLAIAAAGVLFTACKDENDDGNTSKTTYEFSVKAEDNPISAPADGKTYTILVTSTKTAQAGTSAVAYEVVSSPEWAPAELEQTALVITVAKNSSTEAREPGKVVLKQDESDKTLEITINQAGFSNSMSLDATYSTDRCKVLVIEPTITGFDQNPVYKWTVKGPNDAEAAEAGTDKTLSFIQLETGDYTISLTISDDSGITETKSATVTVTTEATAYSYYISEVLEYNPAITNGKGLAFSTIDTPSTVLASVNTKLVDKPFDKNDLGVNLGSFGGSIVFRFDHTVMNVNGLRDFRIGSYATKGAYPAQGVVYVSSDANGNGKADAVTKMLPIYDNLERALNQPTEDAAYKKGVELTMTELLKILNGLGVEVFGEVGDTFDPNLHNAVMHLDSEEHDENVITQVFQKGFKMGDKIVRFAMVQVAN